LWRVHTTLVREIQVKADQIVRRYALRLAGNGIHNAAALILEVDTGNVAAYVGNISDFTKADHGNHVDIINAARSSGSILKPLLYAGMLHAGELLPTQLIPDIPTRMGGFAPENYSRTYQGAVPAQKALARSLNIPAVRMLHAFGVNRFYTLLKNLGLTTLHRPAEMYGLSLILGGAEATLWEITGIYAGLARSVNRFHRMPAADHEPEPVFAHPRHLHVARQPERGVRDFTAPVAPLDAGDCWLALQAMLEVVRPGAESGWKSFSSSRKIAWKTGTSYGFRDAWAVGITPQYAVGVWAGNADGEGRPGLTGISAAAPILFDLFGMLNTNGWFLYPEADLVQLDVCAQSGYRRGPNCQKTLTVSVSRAGLKTRACPYCIQIHCNPSKTFRVHGDCQRIADIRQVKWFVLPPALEWYYQKSHSEYLPLPPYRPDCREHLAGFNVPSMNLIYPGTQGQIYIPVELDGTQGQTVFEAAHRNPTATIFWHLDDLYLGATEDIHRMALAPGAGKHRLTLVDHNGERLERKFLVLSKE
jgi:penicillin-binding protein 1C